MRQTRSRRRSSTGRPAPPRALGGLRERLAAIDRIDFFGSAGRDRVVNLIEQVTIRQAQRQLRPSDVEVIDNPGKRPRHALWITRPRPGVDRMASAWLIRRFIDPDARFRTVMSRSDG